MYMRVFEPQQITLPESVVIIHNLGDLTLPIDFTLKLTICSGDTFQPVLDSVYLFEQGSMIVYQTAQILVNLVAQAFEYFQDAVSSLIVC